LDLDAHDAKCAAVCLLIKLLGIRAGQTSRSGASA
jgi:hypothetical protein